ncbi:MAG: T9SS type A sorting domain-containing protein, partial [Muribaculaceae bacterium]|nr:T9SS type A sorting domain-containing protein [Muribaculaceae bacterium]
TLSWNEVEGATNYGVIANMTHVAKQDEVYNIVNATFDEVVDGTMESPCDYTWDEYYNYDVEQLFGIVGSYADGWDCYANGVFGLNGSDSDGWEYYANFVSGDLDLSANGGAGTIELDVWAPAEHMYKVELYRMSEAWERIERHEFYGTGNWEHNVIEFTNANERCYIYIQYFRNGHMYIDNFKIKQNLKAGDEVVKSIGNKTLYGENSTTINFPECCDNDKITYQVNASLWYYTTYTDDYGTYSWPHTAIFGDYSEAYTLERSSSLHSINNVVGGAEVVGGRLKIDADADDKVCVYSVSGVLVYSGNVSNANGLLLPSGMYVVSIGDDVYKIACH